MIGMDAFLSEESTASGGDSLKSHLPDSSTCISWPQHGIRVLNGNDGDQRETVKTLSKYFKDLKKKIESASPPLSPVDGESKGASICQGFIQDIGLLSPTKDIKDGTWQYLENNDWLKIKPLGEGSSGTVSEAQDITTEGHCAVKQIPFMSYESFEGVAWSEFTHPNIPKLYGIVRESDESGGKVFLFCEKIENAKPLLEFVDDNKYWPTQLMKQFLDNVTKQIEDGVDHIHSKGIAHNDLGTCGNVMIEDWHDGKDRKAWILDFGRASRITKDTQDDKGKDKMAVEEMIKGVYGVLEERIQTEKEIAEWKENKELKKQVDKTDKRMQQLQIDQDMPDESGAAPLLPQVGPPDDANWQLTSFSDVANGSDDSQEKLRIGESGRVGMSRFFRVTLPSNDSTDDNSNIKSSAPLISSPSSALSGTESVQETYKEVQLQQPENQETGAIPEKRGNGDSKTATVKEILPINPQ